MRKRYNFIRKNFGQYLGENTGKYIADICVEIYENLWLFKLHAIKYYEQVLSPIFAIYGKCILWPISYILYINKIRFLTNLTVGNHLVGELDFFFRQINNNSDLQKFKYICITKNDGEISETLINGFKHNFFFATSNNWIYWITLPLIMSSSDNNRVPIRIDSIKSQYYKDIRIETGFGRVKPHTIRKDVKKIGEYKYLLLLTISETLKEKRVQLQEVNNDVEYYPLYNNYKYKKVVMPFLSNNTKKIALIHVKYEVRNATAKPTDPNSYLETLNYLKDLKYYLIFVGRERMPFTFRKFIDYNYSESNYACFRNDIELFRIADIAITAASGIGWYSAFKGVPLLYLNSWHLSTPPIKNCVSVPSLIRKQSGQYYKFEEQLKLFTGIISDDDSWNFSEYDVRDAKAEEILEATKELILLKEMQLLQIQ